MGNDGGSIPTRRELVREAARNPNTTEVKEAQREQLEYFWSTCPLSLKKLLLPIVSDGTGNLYNKDAILQYLLPGDDDGLAHKAECDEVLRGRVKSLRDIVELKFEVRGSDEEPNEKYKSQWICPVTHKEIGPKVKCVYLVPCGHVFSEEAIREMKSDQCLQCNESYEPDNVIPILPIKEAEKTRLLSRIEVLSSRGLTHSLKKLPGSSKKRKKQRLEQSTLVDGEENARQPTAPGPQCKTSTPIPSSAFSGIKNASTAMLTARVLEEQNERRKRAKVSTTSDSLKALFTSSKSGNEKQKADFMTRGFSIG
ncbi:hypothetical protein FQN57_005575 [Myotisia sp. PD_48]|nr:hypothetical protein FQN57_005575 [Myotisia sp. PD_48]